MSSSHLWCWNRNWVDRNCLKEFYVLCWGTGPIFSVVWFNGGEAVRGLCCNHKTSLKSSDHWSGVHLSLTSCWVHIRGEAENGCVLMRLLGSSRNWSGSNLSGTILVVQCVTPGSDYCNAWEVLGSGTDVNSTDWVSFFCEVFWDEHPRRCPTDVGIGGSLWILLKLFWRRDWSREQKGRGDAAGKLSNRRTE